MLHVSHKGQAIVECPIRRQCPHFWGQLSHLLRLTGLFGQGVACVVSDARISTSGPMAVQGLSCSPSDWVISNAAEGYKGGFGSGIAGLSCVPRLASGLLAKTEEKGFSDPLRAASSPVTDS